MRKSAYKDQKRLREVIRKQKRRYYGKTSNAKNGSQPWTLHDIELVMEHRISDTELSAQIGRSVSAIQQMRSKQRKKS